MNKPASYFARLRRRKAAPKPRKRNEILRDEDIVQFSHGSAHADTAVRKPELANEF